MRDWRPRAYKRALSRDDHGVTRATDRDPSGKIDETVIRWLCSPGGDRCGGGGASYVAASRRPVGV